MGDIQYQEGTDSNGGNLRCSGVYWRVHWWPSVTLGGAAAIFRAEVNIDSKEVLSSLGFPVGDKWLASGIPSRIKRINAARVETVSTLARDDSDARERHT
jgi:hypothetical protein